MRIQKGELDPNAAFMQGRIKVTGNMGKLMGLLAHAGERVREGQPVAWLRSA